MGMERILLARRSLVAVLRTAGYSWMAGRNFSWTSQMLRRVRLGCVGAVGELTRVLDVLEVGCVVSGGGELRGESCGLILLVEVDMVLVRLNEVEE
jgi:hypothetical protein